MTMMPTSPANWRQPCNGFGSRTCMTLGPHDYANVTDMPVPAMVGKVGAGLMAGMGRKQTLSPHRLASTSSDVISRYMQIEGLVMARYLAALLMLVASASGHAAEDHLQHDQLAPKPT